MSKKRDDDDMLNKVVSYTVFFEALRTRPREMRQFFLGFVWIVGVMIVLSFVILLIWGIADGTFWRMLADGSLWRSIKRPDPVKYMMFAGVVLIYVPMIIKHCLANAVRKNPTGKLARVWGRVFPLSDDLKAVLYFVAILAGGGFLAWVFLFSKHANN